MPTGRLRPARPRASSSITSQPAPAPANTAKSAPALPAATTRCWPEAHNRFGVVTPFGGPTSSGMLTLHCPPMQLYALGSFLRDHGADTVSVASLDYVLDRENPLFARLEAFLRQ